MAGPMHRRATLVALAAVSGALTLAGSPAFGIANGTPVTDGRYGFAAKLTYDMPMPDGSIYHSACSGTLIAPQWVITAGHCFRSAAGRYSNDHVEHVTVTVGRADINASTGDVVPVVAAYQAPSGDVAMAKLATPVTDVRPLGLSTATPRRGQLLRLAGWGATTGTNPTPSDRLNTGIVRVRTVAGPTLKVSGYAPRATTSPCMYDSGAGYFTQSGRTPLLVAVESDGPTCPHSSVETTTRVGPLAGWIRSIQRTK